MASPGSSQDVKIFSSVRPLQIQRSFEVSETAESLTQEISIEKQQSTVTISSQTSSTNMSISQSTSDGSIRIAASPLTVTPGIVIKTATSPASPTSPGTILIRSSSSSAAEPGGASNPQTGVGQNFVIIKSATGAVPTGSAQPQVPVQGTVVQQQVPVQGTVVIKSGAAHQPIAQSKIVINSAAATQSRIIINASSTLPAPAQIQGGAEVINNEVPATESVPQARRSSLTIKAGQTTPTSDKETSITNSPATVQLQNPEIPAGSTASNHVTLSEHLPPESKTNPPTDQVTPEPNSTPSTARKDLSEKVHQKKPAGPSFEEVLEKVNLSSLFFVAFLVLLTVVVCIVGEGEIPLSWILSAIAAFSLVSFVALRL